MDKIKQLIEAGNADEAIRLLDVLLAENASSDEAYFLRGRAYAKKGDFPHALNNYLSAIALNPDSPAVEAHSMLMKIMNFFNKDMYNH
ncbi:MAG: tetratricopeptide repeat protein [Tannerellaceae bacterium]